MKKLFRHVYSRIKLDAAIFTFGYLADKPNILSLHLFCAGSESESFEALNPLTDVQLVELISSLKSLSPNHSKLKLKIRVGALRSIRFKVSGFDEAKGYKVRAFLTGFLYFSSSGFFSSYCSEGNMAALISNLEKCVG